MKLTSIVDPGGPTREMEVFLKGRTPQDQERSIDYIKMINVWIRLCSSPFREGTNPNAIPKIVNSTRAKMIITG